VKTQPLQNQIAATSVLPIRLTTESEQTVIDASNLLQRMFKNFAGELNIRLWNGASLALGRTVASDAPPPFTLVFHHPNVVRSMVLGRDPLRLAEAYFRGDIDIEGDFFAALRIKDYLRAICLSHRDRLLTLFSAIRLRSHVNNTVYAELQAKTKANHQAPAHGGIVKSHSKSENDEAIQFHYDVSNQFYRLWLGESMVYSCAYFVQANHSLEVAQQAKLDHICAKLMLAPGEMLLDIGCGWGALVIHAARHYGVRAHGITLSQQQLDVARERIAEAGLADRVTVALCDYRDLNSNFQYDKISSVGMFEHVGLGNLLDYFATVHRVLKPAGLFLNHGITHDVEGWNKTTSTEFINRYVFPDGQLDTVSNVQREMERARFEIADVEALRPHYALTLRHWVQRLEANHAEALEYVSEPIFRVWRLYMAACALEFESGELGVYQILAAKRTLDSTKPSYPLTRQHIYVAPSVSL
jgi:cyclopropane-fatty-acyl-phospholipid synthase